MRLKRNVAGDFVAGNRGADFVNPLVAAPCAATRGLTGVARPGSFASVPVNPVSPAILPEIRESSPKVLAR